jgi:hypothetical protein
VSPREIAHWRLSRQQIVASHCTCPGEVVATLGAMQAQDYLGALWAIGTRLPDATEVSVEAAIAARSVVRSWPMRGTLHFVAPVDLRWMLELCSPRIIAGSAARARELELDAKVFTKCEKIFVHALQGGQPLTREAMMALLEKRKIPTTGQRGYHILWRLAQEGVLVFGPRSGKSQTFALLEEWIPPAQRWGREAALAELARRYFTSHGPATAADFSWWSGLKITDARAGLDSVALELRHEKVDAAEYWISLDAEPPGLDSASVQLLPGFDEYLLGYKDRSAVLSVEHMQKIVPGSNGMFAATVVIDGRIAGTWKRTLAKRGVTVAVEPFRRFKGAETTQLYLAVQRYGKFLGLPAKLA